MCGCPASLAGGRRGSRAGTEGWGGFWGGLGVHGCSNEQLAERHQGAQAMHVLGAGKASLSPAPVLGLCPCSTSADGLQLHAGCLQSCSFPLKFGHCWRKLLRCLEEGLGWLLLSRVAARERSSAAPARRQPARLGAPPSWVSAITSC